MPDPSYVYMYMYICILYAYRIHRQLLYARFDKT
jgi:hypothetical protein